MFKILFELQRNFIEIQILILNIRYKYLLDIFKKQSTIIYIF